MKLPKGWEIVSLEKVAKIQTGLAKGKKDQKNVVSLPYLRVANVQDGYLDLSEIKEIEVDSSQVNRYLLQNEDILLTEGGDFDKLGRGDIWHCQINPCLHQNHVFAVRVNRENLIPYFFAQQVSSFYGKAYFLSCAKQTTNLASINSTQLKEFPVLLPPLLEQCRIAEMLGVWDESIDLLERLIGRVRSRKQGLMQQLLTGKKRFKEFEGIEWKTTFIKKIAKLTAGGTPDTNIVEYWNGDIPWMKSGDVNLRKIYDIDGRITQSGFDNSSTKRIPPHSVLIALAGQGKTRGLVAINEMELCTNQSIAAIMPDSSKLYFEYLYYNLDSRYQELRGLSSGDGGRGGLNLKILGQIEICLPSLPEQEKIAAVLSAADDEISTLEKQLAAYKQQKLGLMQQLLTGNIRI
jgi:type I restriction enzyme, S subunit